MHEKGLNMEQCLPVLLANIEACGLQMRMVPGKGSPAVLQYEYTDSEELTIASITELAEQSKLDLAFSLLKQKNPDFELP